MQHEEVPVAKLGCSEAAAAICGIPPERAMGMHLEFKGMITAHNKKAFHARSGRKKLSKLDFLDLEREDLDPRVGLFKSLHLLECDRTVFRRSRKPKELLKLAKRMVQLSKLSVHYQSRLAEDSGSLSAYLKAVEDDLSMVLYQQPTPQEVEELIKNAIEGTWKQDEAFELLAHYVEMRHKNAIQALIRVICAQTKHMESGEQAVLEQAQKRYPTAPWHGTQDINAAL